MIFVILDILDVGRNSVLRHSIIIWHWCWKAWLVYLSGTKLLVLAALNLAPKRKAVHNSKLRLGTKFTCGFCLRSYGDDLCVPVPVIWRWGSIARVVSVKV